MSSSSFTFDGIEFNFDLTVPKCFVLKKEFGINLLNLFEDENLSAFATTMALNDEKMLDLFWWVVSKKLTDQDAVYEKVTRDILTKFKECVWQGVINFSDPAAKPILKEFKQRLPELLEQNALSMFRQETQPLSENS